jgi:predicted aspartyl protease
MKKETTCKPSFQVIAFYFIVAAVGYPTHAHQEPISHVGAAPSTSKANPAAPLERQDRPNTSSAVRFELLSNFLVVVKGQIGNLDGLKFILDTGASESMVDRDLANELKLQRRSGQVMNFDHEIHIEWAVVPELRVGPIHVQATPVMVGKIADYSSVAKNVDGIIGLDILSAAKRFTIDYENRAVWFEPARESTGLRAAPSALVIPFVIQGFAMHLVVDTAFQGVLLYADQLRKHLRHLRTEGKSQDVTIGRLRAKQVKLANVQITGQDVVSTVWLIEGPGDSVLPDVDGYLGPVSLHAKRIEFDLEAMTLHWQ